MPNQQSINSCRGCCCLRCTVRGDPNQRSQRVFVVAVHVLLALTLNIIFFDEYEECVYPCDSHMPAGTDDVSTKDPACTACPAEQDPQLCGLGNGPVDGDRTCAEEELPGLTASLVTVAIIVPVIGIVNFAFGWLRKPLIADIMMRSGEMLDRLQEETTHERAYKRAKLMLAAMTPNQVRSYADEVVDTRDNRQRIDTKIVERIVEETADGQREKLDRLNKELKEHSKSQNDLDIVTDAHRTCAIEIFMAKAEADQHMKKKLVDILLTDHDKLHADNLTRELQNLPLQQIRARQAKHRIKYTVDDEDAWENGGAYDHEQDEESHFLTDEAKQDVEEGRKETEEQLKKEQGELVELIVKAEMRKPTKTLKFRRWLISLRPHAATTNCLRVQRLSLVKVCPCCEKTIKAEFDEDGAIGIKFAPNGTSVEVVAIKEHYQADLDHHELCVGLVLRSIDGVNVNRTNIEGSRKQHVLGMLHNAGRPLRMVFVPGERDDDDDDDGLDTDSNDDDEEHENVGGANAFWDDEEHVPDDSDEIEVEDIDETSADQSEEEELVRPEEEENVPRPLREYGSALVARQHLKDTVERMAEVIDQAAPDAPTQGGDAQKAIEKNCKAKMQELAKKREELKEADKKVEQAAKAAGYIFAKCTIHVEHVPDAFGQRRDDGTPVPLHEEVQSLFSVFGRVLQVTIQRRPGTNSNWALVTLCDQDSIKSCLSNPRRYAPNHEPTEEQQKNLKRIKALQASKMYASSYGHSWLEASEKAEATICGLALRDEGRVRDDYGKFATTAHTKKNKKSVEVPRRRAPVCERRRQVAAQMRVCETAVDALFYACDRDNSGTLDREELAILMAELTGGARVSEFSVQFVMDQVQSHGDGAITREQLKPAITLWRYLQHEQDFVAQHFDEFDKRTKGKMIGKDEVGLLLQRLNSDNEHPDGIPPAVAEVEWVMNKASASDTVSGVNRAELRSAVALWYPFVYNRRRVEDLPSSVQAKAGRRRRAANGMLGLHKHHVNTVLDSEYPPKVDPENPGQAGMYGLTVAKDLGDMMETLISSPVQREHVGKDDVEYMASTADLQGTETFEPDDVKNALAMWLATRAVQPDIDAALEPYEESNTGPEQRRQVHSILTELNDGIPLTWAETDWILESSDIDGNGTISRDEMRASVGWWFLHVSRRQVVTVSGWKALAPWMSSAVVGLACTYLVAATSVRFDEPKTQRWLENTILAVVFKQCIVDPLKVLFCGTLLEPVATLFSLDFGLGEFDLSEAVGEVLEDLGEDGVDDIGAQMAAQSLVGRDDWERDIGLTDKERKKAAHQNVFLGGSRSVAKMKGIAQNKRVKSHAVHAATEAARDSQRTLAKMQSQRAEMNAIYAEKVAQKRLDKGLNRGTFAARAEVDIIAVSQFMATEQENTKNEERTVKAEIKELDAQEAAELVKEGEMARRGEPWDARELRRIRDKRARARQRHQVIAEKNGDLEYKAGNEAELMAKAQREGSTHARHIAHLKGLQSAKTMERVRRKRDAKKGVAAQQDSGVALRKSRWGERGKGALGLAKIMGGGSRQQVAVRAEEKPAMTSVMLAEAGLRRSAAIPNQLKVYVPTGPLGAQSSAPAQHNVIDELAALDAELDEAQRVRSMN